MNRNKENSNNLKWKSSLTNLMNTNMNKVYLAQALIVNLKDNQLSSNLFNNGRLQTTNNNFLNLKVSKEISNGLQWQVEIVQELMSKDSCNQSDKTIFCPTTSEKNCKIINNGTLTR